MNGKITYPSRNTFEKRNMQFLSRYINKFGYSLTCYKGVNEHKTPVYSIVFVNEKYLPNKLELFDFYNRQDANEVIMRFTTEGEVYKDYSEGMYVKDNETRRNQNES